MKRFMVNKRYLKYRLKMQRKFDELFGNKIDNEIGDVKIMKEYTTKSFFIQCMLSEVEGVRIIGFERDRDEDREAITYEFEADNREAINCISDCRNGMYMGIEISNFNEKKKNRKKMINKYYERLNGECK